MNINIKAEVFHHRCDDDILNKILESQLLIKQKLEKIMAKSQERFDLIIGRLNTITSDIAADYQKLLDAVKDTISEESFAAAEANIAQLEALGASVDNPVPEPPVE